jgi:hypothetical protein
MVRGHPGNPGCRAELSDDRRYRFQRLKTLRHAAGVDVGRSRNAYPRR